MKKIKFILPVLVVIAAVAFLWRNVNNQDQEAPGTIAGNGIVEATEVEVSSKVAGRLLTLTVNEGDSVTEGQLVGTLDNGDLAGKVEQAQGSLAAARAVLAELEAGTRPEEIRNLRAQLEAANTALEQAEARRDLVRAGPRREKVEQLKAALRQVEVSLADAETDLGRMETLESSGAVSVQELDRARTRRDLFRTQVDAARQRLEEAETGARPEELREAEAAVDQAEARVKAAKAALDLALAGPRSQTIEAARARVAQARGALSSAEYLLEQTRIYSPIDGRVTLRNSEPGEVITPGFPILRLANLEMVFLRVYVPEPRVGQVKLGQGAEVTTDSFPGKNYPGRVVEISEKPEFTPKNVQTREERVKLVFGVKIEVENDDQELKPGMPADAVIDISEG
jgi:HlyD family secretion protein